MVWMYSPYWMFFPLWAPRPTVGFVLHRLNAAGWPATARVGAGAPGETSRLGEGAAQQVVDLGVRAAQLVPRPPRERVVDGGIESQQHLFTRRTAWPLGHW